MSARITMRDDEGRPLRVETDDGFCLHSGPYDEKLHGWIDDQLDPETFTAIIIGRQTEWLVANVNALRRRNWQLEQELEQWKSAAGFGKRA